MLYCTKLVNLEHLRVILHLKHQKNLEIENLVDHNVEFTHLRVQMFLENQFNLFFKLPSHNFFVTIGSDSKRSYSLMSDFCCNIPMLCICLIFLVVLYHILFLVGVVLCDSSLSSNFVILLLLG